MPNEWEQVCCPQPGTIRATHIERKAAPRNRDAAMRDPPLKPVSRAYPRFRFGVMVSGFEGLVVAGV